MPIFESSVESPMPECMRIAGVMIVPAERITSFAAVRLYTVAGKSVSQTFCYIPPLGNV